MWRKIDQHAFKEVKDRLSTIFILMLPNWDETLYISLSMGGEAIGVVLMQKGVKQSYMWSIYYIVEKVWTDEEKLVWALVLSLQRWKSYLLGRTTTILTSCTLVAHMLRFLGDGRHVK